MRVPTYRLVEGVIASLHEQEVPQRVIAWTLAVAKVTVSRHIAALPCEPATPFTHGPREPRPPLTLEQQCMVIAFFCQSSPPPGMQRWTLRIAARYINETPELLGRMVHHSTIGRLLARHHMRPHKLAYFLHIRDPFFFEKMHHVLAVYATKSKYLFCFDECPNIQAISRRGPHAPQSNAATQCEFVYQRNGTTDLFGFLQVSRGTIDTYCRPSHETETLIEVFSAHVQAQPQGEQLHYICDNLSTHFNMDFCKAVAKLSKVRCPPAKRLATGKLRREWLQSENKRIVIHFLPFHGSWLNQVEVWFGLLRRYSLIGGWFESVDALIAAIEAFARTWNDQLAHPFDFRYTGQGLEGVTLRRFTRILSQDSEKLAQLDSKFIADMSLLCVRLITHHRHAINEDDTSAFRVAVAESKSKIQAIINAEPGPQRRPRAQKAFQSLIELLAA